MAFICKVRKLSCGLNYLGHNHDVKIKAPRFSQEILGMLCIFIVNLIHFILSAL